MSRAGRLPVKDDVDLFESIGISPYVKGVTFNLRVAEVLCAQLFGTHTSLYTLQTPFGALPVRDLARTRVQQRREPSRKKTALNSAHLMFPRC